MVRGVVPGYDGRVTGVLAAAFLLFGLVRIAYHEMWRDEWWVWLMARDSPSIARFLHTTSYQGHPPLWDLSIYALTGLTRAPVAMQVLHVGLAAAAVSVVSRFSSLTRVERWLFAFGYFPFFEYAVISRNYVLDLLFLAVACALYSTRRTAPVPLAVSLALLALSDVLGVILATALALAYALELRLMRWAGTVTGVGSGALGGGAAVVLAGLALATVASIPPADSGLPSGWAFELDRRLLGVASPLWRGYVPLPPPSAHFWSANILDALGEAGETWQALLSLPLLLAGLLVAVRRPATLVLWLAGTAGMLGFWHVKFSGSLRHHGHLFLLLVATCWLAESSQPWPRSPAGLAALSRLGDGCRRRLLPALLVVHVAAGLVASALDLLLPFSASPAVARFIERRFPPDLPILGDRDGPAMAVAGALGRPLYYPASGRVGTFIVQDNRRRRVSRDELLAHVAALQDRTGRDVLLVLSYPLDPPVTGVEPLGRFGDSIVETERYHLYLARRASPPPPSGTAAPRPV
jgi:hypothetical protein